MSTKAKAGSGPTPGRVMSRCAAGNLPASSSTRLLSSAILGLMRSSNSADHLVADSHRALAPHFPVASFLLPATVLSYGGCPHSKPRLATDSSIAYASAPCGADARATDADPGSPNSPPRSAENAGLPAYSNHHRSFSQSTIKLFRFLPMCPSAFLQLARFCIHI